MPPEAAPRTSYGIEYACDVQRQETVWDVELIPCFAIGGTTPLNYAAFSDGTNFYDDADGAFVAWTDWPPAGFEG
jgi:hypothetical protein